MGFFSKFESRMEDTFEGAANKMFDAPISPVQIAKKAERMMRREKMVGAGKQYAPTLYTVLVNYDDDERLFGYYPTLAGETETYLAARAESEGLVMDGQPLVRFIVDNDLKHGKFDVIAELVASPIVAQLRAEEMERYGISQSPDPYGQHPDTVVFAAGSGNAAPRPNAGSARARLVDRSTNQTWDLASSRFVIGREHGNDIVIDDINASRTHAELRFEPQGVWVLSDLGSTNGTSVNGTKITSQALHDGDRITIGMTTLVFQMM